MFCYIILHYKVLEETVSCIESIQKNNPAPKKLIVVDNYSNNGTGERLQELFADDTEVDVLITDENMGFARGNNVGYQHAKTHYNPEFMVIMNNDIEIETPDFEQVVRDVYQEHPFHIMGPDIFSTTYELHQNPKRLEHYTKEEVAALNARFKKNMEPHLALRVKSWIKSLNGLRTWIYQRRTAKKQLDVAKVYENPILHGSFLVYSSDFIQQEDLAFNPHTFFYYETEILDYECEQKGYKRLYHPAIKVLHHQNRATNHVYKNILEKTLFSNKCNYESTTYWLTLMAENQE